MRKAFTLVELLIVIAIISLLATASVKMIGAARASGHSARCQGNLKALWQGVMNCASESDSGDLPYAGSHDFYWPHDNRHHCHNGWVCWIPADGGAVGSYYPLPANKPDRVGSVRQHSGSVEGKDRTEAHSLVYPVVGGTANEKNDNAAVDSIRYSSFFTYVNEDMSIYCCPAFRSVVPGAKRSYVMNEWFGSRRNIRHHPVHLHKLGDGVQASRILLFTEMPFTAGSSTGKRGGNPPYNWNDFKGEVHGEVNRDRGLSQDSVFDCYVDAVKNSHPKEVYGCLHRKSGRMWAHAIFLDGHIESLCETDPKGETENYQVETSKKIALGRW
ncbi:MAG: type II secretion system protein [Kiritimatiellia bacterium]|jgi:prepilin-type N-terminal cleavage/methylation domain-containing protein